MLKWRISNDVEMCVSCRKPYGMSGDGDDHQSGDGDRDR